MIKNHTIKKRLRTLAERGDTVVEVLISIAVVSLVLGGAFVTANRSLQGTRDAQERQNALKMAEAQVEKIKYTAGATPQVIFGTSTPAAYCLLAGAALDESDTRCTFDGNGISPASGQPTYDVTITRSGNLFTVRSTWTKIGTDRQNTVELKYRAYP
ncbi:MAG: type II secretion system protein [Candidatus Saccharimonadales bacterium]